MNPPDDSKSTFNILEFISTLSPDVRAGLMQHFSSLSLGPPQAEQVQAPAEIETDEASGLDVQWKVPVLFHETSQKTFYLDKEGGRHSIRVLDTLENEAYCQRLLTKGQSFIKDNRMDEDSLVVLVKTSVLPLDFDEQFVRRAAAIVNAHLPSLEPRGYNHVSELHLHSTVYGVILDLFFAFGPRRCRSNQKVECSHCINVELQTGTSPAVVSVMPDGALTTAEGFNVIAMMELNPANVDFDEDLDKCILMTTVSILALDQTRNRLLEEMPSMDLRREIVIPFVLGNHDRAQLFVTRLAKPGARPTVERVLIATFNDEEHTGTSPLSPKLQFCTVLTVLLGDIASFYALLHQEQENELIRRPRMKFGNAWRSKRPSADTGDRATSNQRPPNESAVTRFAGPTLHEQEQTASIVASRGSRVKNLQYPWLRYRNALSTFAWDEDADFYQHESPFYFKGVVIQSNENERSVPVFCKVWRDGDDRTCRRNINDEMRLFKKASENGVPTPTIQEDLTAMDIVEPQTATVYHVLVTTFEDCDNLAVDDILLYALSLIRAVMQLHAIRVLHCDIKPRNVLWSATKKKAILVDFGHAQDEDEARSYDATKEFQAPEISLGTPHSKKSDAFSVGKTVEDVMTGVLKQSHDVVTLQSVDVVKDVVNQLLCLTTAERMSLSEAEAKLLQYQQSSSSLVSSEKESRKRHAVGFATGSPAISPSLRGQVESKGYRMTNTE